MFDSSMSIWLVRISLKLKSHELHFQTCLSVVFFFFLPKVLAPVHLGILRRNRCLVFQQKAPAKSGAYLEANELSILYRSLKHPTTMTPSHFYRSKSRKQGSVWVSKTGHGFCCRIMRLSQWCFLLGVSSKASWKIDESLFKGMMCHLYHRSYD